MVRIDMLTLINGTWMTISRYRFSLFAKARFAKARFAKARFARARLQPTDRGSICGGVGRWPDRLARMLCLLSAICVAPAAVASAAIGVAQDQIQLTVVLRDGSVLAVQADNRSFEWKTVADDGSISLRDVELSNLKQLVLTKNPGSQQVAEIRRLVSDLASERYVDRHRAEKRLMAEGQPFLTVIQQQSSHKEPEVRYRVSRILNQLSRTKRTNTNPVALEFDKLLLGEGEKLDGDVVDWTLQCRWQGNDLELDRSQIHSIFGQMPEELVASAPGPVPFRVRSLIRDDLFFAEDGSLRADLVQSDFETGPHGEVMVNDKTVDVGDYFSFLGCLTRCETNNGRVIISGFRFKESRSSRNSIANIFPHPETGKDIRYQGVMRIEFCLPQHPHIPAAVKRVGMFLEIVAPQHTIVEAYDAADHLIGVTQTGRQRSSFVGFDSDIPIAHLKVRANQYITTESLNRDFAVDDICFSTPAVAPQLNRSKYYTVVTDDGQRILANSVELTDNHVLLGALTIGQNELKLPLNQVRWLVAPHSKIVRPQEGYSVMTRDGSVVHCTAGMQLEMAALSDIKLSDNDIAGIWQAALPARYVNATDFQHGDVVVARPLNRVALQSAALDATASLLEVELDGASNLQQAMIDDEQDLLIAEATKSDLGIEEAATAMSLDSDVTVWFHAPPIPAGGVGMLRTTDGQQFVLGGEFGFVLQKLSSDAVVIAKDERAFSIKLNQIRAIRFSDDP